MPKFLLLYTGPATKPEDMTPEQSQTEMGLWAKWMEGVGSAMSDMGSPTGASGAVMDDGSDGSALDITGYTIVEADDLAGAQALCEGHPFIRDATGKFSISVHELLPIPEM